MVRLLEKFEECHVKVRFEKCHLFMGIISIVGMFCMGQCVVPPLRRWMRYAINPSLKPQSR